MPLLAKPASIIAYGDFKRSFTYDYAENADIVVYALEDGESASAKLYDADSREVLSVTAQRCGDVIRVKTEGTAKNFKVRSSQGLAVEMA